MISSEAPRAFICWNTSRICACTVASSAVVGSSAITSAGSRARALAISARWRRPPDNCPGRWRARSCTSGTPTRSSNSCIRAGRVWRSPYPCVCSTSRISLPTGRSGSSDTSASCSTKPISLPRTARHWRSLRSSRSWSPKLKRRALTCARPPASPTRQRALTLLPEPDSPTKARQRPGGKVKDRSRTTLAPSKATFSPSTIRVLSLMAGAPPGVVGYSGQSPSSPGW